MGKPVKSFKCGAVEAAIFENEIAKGKEKIKVKKVVLQKRYRTADGEWKSTNSLDVNDIPRASLALDSAFEFLVMRGDGGEKVEDEGEAD